MITDNVLLENSLRNLIDYNWKDELTNFEETFDVEVKDETTDYWIKKCQSESMTDHIFYSLLILKSYLGDETN